MTISARRNLYLLISLSAVPVVKMIDSFIKKNMTIDYTKKSIEKILNIVLSIICIVVIIFSTYNFVKSSNKEYINENLYPVQATKWIKNNLDLENIKIYNQYDFGSYLLWQGVPVFIDSRCDLYTKQFNKGVTVLDDFMDVYSGKLSYIDLFEKYKITHAIVYKNSVENTYMSKDENCKNLYEDDNFIIYEYIK